MVSTMDSTATHTQTIHDLFADQASRSPAAVALKCRGQSVSYAELESRSNRLAQYLKSRGVQTETYVAVLMERSADLVVALLAILKAGGAYAPLDPRWPPARLAFMMRDTAAPIVVTQAELAAQLPDHGATVVCIDSDWDSIAQEPDRCPPGDVVPENLAYVNYTSGSTGQPKGVEVLHRGVTRLVKDTNYADFGSDHVFLHFAPITFDAATFEIWGALLNGATLAIIHHPLPSLRELGDFIQAEGITTLWLTAGLFHKMVEHNLGGLKGVQQLLTGGDVVSVRHTQQYLQHAGSGRLINGYGPTENTTFTTCYPMTADTQLGKTVPIGKPISQTQVYLLDEQLQPVADGQPGELYVGGRGLARGYLNRPDLTDERFLANPFSQDGEDRLYRTGDLVRYLPDGNIEFLGRTDDQVKIRGFRIELEEIRTVINQHPAIKDSIVIARDERGGDKQLVAYLVPDAAQAAAVTGGEPGEKHVSEWQTLYDQLYDPTAETPQASGEADFNIVGWHSSYTREPIAAEQMQEWVECTVGRILSLQPERVLEIGCGTGLLLFRVAPHCAEYLATDLSAVVIRGLQAKLAQAEPPLPQVRLLPRPADNFQEVAPQSYDTVVLNSVVQYFPDLAYLESVLTDAVRSLRPGGRVFVGDVRSLPLLEAFHTAVQLHQASPQTPVDVLCQRIDWQRAQEDELVISPAFFANLTDVIPQIQRVEVQPKRGHFQNEMTQFRYDVVLHVGDSRPAVVQPEWKDWQSDQLTLDSVRRWLSQTADSTVGIRNVTNSHLAHVMAAISILSQADAPGTVGELREQLQAPAGHEAVTPEELVELGESLGFDVKLSWLAGRCDGAFDVAFCRKGAEAGAINFSGPADDSGPLATVPGRGKGLQRLLPNVRQHASAHLPDYMVPTFLVALDSLPLNANGKVDRRALPPPDLEQGRSQAPYQPPADEWEEALVEIWQQALGIEPIGVGDNFFDLGGSSLLAAEMFHTIGTRFQRDFPLAMLAQHPTIRSLAKVLRDNDHQTSWQTLVPIQPSGNKTPLFCMHGGLGNVVSFRELAQLLDDDQPLYGLQWNGLDGSRGHTCIKAMAADYISQIREIQPRGPYLLAGHCVGGITAYEMGRQLQAAGEEVALLVMFDTPHVKSSAYRKPTPWKLLKVNVRWLLTECRYAAALVRHRCWGTELSDRWEKYRESRPYKPNLLLSAVVSGYRAAGRRVPAKYRSTHAISSTLAAVRSYHPAPYAGRVALFHAGTEQSRYVTGFHGQLVDGMFGWRPEASDTFEFYPIPNVGHVSIVTSETTAQILSRCLHEAHAEIAAQEGVVASAS